MLLQNKNKRLDAPCLTKLFIVLEKPKFEHLQAEIFVDVEGCWAIPKLMVLTFLKFILVNLASYPYEKNFTTKKFSHSFSAGLDD
jgi:hypothetical protein